MKILLISPLPPPIGGIASWTVNLIYYIDNNPSKNKLILCNNSIKGRLITSQSLIIRLYTGIYNTSKLFLNLRKYIRVNKPTIIHLVSSASLALIKDCFIVYIANYHKIPIVLHWHFGRIPTLAKQRNWEWKLLRYIINKSNTSIVIDKKSYNTLLKEGVSNVINIPNPISYYAEQKIKILHDLNSVRQKGRIIFVGHVIKNKGIFELVEACVANNSVNELLIVGPYEEEVKNELSTIANQRDNGIWLKFIGQIAQNQVLDLMSKSYILALPSYTEGFPLVVIEAMAMGCSVIATEVGAIPEMIDSYSDTPCGICIPIQNAEKLKEAINNLIEDPIKSEIMGKRGIAKVIKNYTIENIHLQYLKIWEDALIIINSQNSTN